MNAKYEANSPTQQQHIGTCPSVQEWTAWGYLCTYTQQDPIYTSVESNYSLYLQTQCTERKEGDKWVFAHQSRSAAYTSGRVARSLFKIDWLCWMYQLSNKQHVVVCWSELILKYG